MTYHIVYYPTPESQFSTGINIEAESMIDALVKFKLDKGIEPVICYPKTK
jgi:hypothetical protein